MEDLLNANATLSIEKCSLCLQVPEGWTRGMKQHLGLLQLGPQFSPQSPQNLPPHPDQPPLGGSQSRQCSFRAQCLDCAGHCLVWTVLSHWPKARLGFFRSEWLAGQSLLGSEAAGEPSPHFPIPGRGENVCAINAQCSSELLHRPRLVVCRCTKNMQTRPGRAQLGSSFG